MKLCYLQHSRRSICMAIAVALLGPLGVAAQPSATNGTDTAAEVPASGGATESGMAAPAAGPDRAAQLPAASSTAPVNLGSIMVTANKRSERLQDVPMAVAALSGDQLDRQSAFSFADYATQVPGLNVISTGAGQTQLVLRGVTSGYGQANASVGTYIDDTPYGSSTVYSAGSLLTPDIDPDDLQRIEVLRGPQGTLYGSNTLGGLVKFVSTPPDSTQFSGRIEAGASSVVDGGSGYDTHVTVNLPLVRDKLALRVNAYDRKDPGYVDNVFTGQKDLDGDKVHGARAQLLWTPTRQFSIKLSALAQNLSSGSLANAGIDVDPVTLEPIYGGLQQSRAASTGKFDLRYRLYSADVNDDFGWAALISTSSYSTLAKGANTDYTTAYAPILNPAFGLTGVGYSLLNPITLGKFTQELRLQSPQDQTLEWRVGAFYTREHSNNVQDLLSFDASTGAPVALPTLGHISVGPAIFKEWAGFGDLTWHVTSQLSLLVGVRYSSDKTSYTQIGNGILVGPTDFTIRQSDSPTTYLLNPSFKFSDDLMVYARIASGFRPGGPNVGVPPGLGAPVTFGPDKLVSYELGLKSTMLDKRMTVDVDAFYIDWSQIQLTSYADGFGFLGNGGKATSRGLEANWQYAPVHGLLLSANASWTDAELAADTPPGLYGYKGDRLPFVPKWNVNLGADYDFPLAGGWSGFAGGSYRFIGARKADFAVVPGPRSTVPSYDEVDLRAGVNYASWTFKAYVKNVTNGRGITSVSPETTDPLGSPFAATYVMPRTVGVSATVNF